MMLKSSWMNIDTYYFPHAKLDSNATVCEQYVTWYMYFLHIFTQIFHFLDITPKSKRNMKKYYIK